MAFVSAASNLPGDTDANSFALFFLDPERLRELSPLRYEWMRQHVATDER